MLRFRCARSARAHECVGRAMGGDLGGRLGWVSPKFECEECEWRARLVLKATNKRLSAKDVELIEEASDSESLQH